MSNSTTGEGEIHKRLMRNVCPKCEQTLQVIEMNAERLTRKCVTCSLVIQDRRESAEFPDDICD